ncbi:hypothetical protein HELRODRAFT_178088 [Helobdella robusta]|uniref:Uncharacterized protein n=1 Tax=Helobdella robusta TaxID=6412 RepID=T1FCP9_HELRO|nr:hypothetical protein HELRODRAFT_178088 [Helobdella robusta]ESN97304.1 hypothetical protein HELRODRAFT_178088 [Helobdella robusta]
MTFTAEELLRIKNICDVKKRVVFLFGNKNKALRDAKTIKRIENWDTEKGPGYPNGGYPESNKKNNNTAEKRTPIPYTQEITTGDKEDICATVGDSDNDGNQEKESSLGRKTKEGNNTIILGCFKGVEELKKRVNFFLEKDTKSIDGYLVHKNIIINTNPRKHTSQMSLDIVESILPYQDANCNVENIKKDPHSLLKSSMRRQTLTNNMCKNENECMCIKTCMEAFRKNTCTMYNQKNVQ